MIYIAEAMVHSGSHLENVWWQQHLSEQINKALNGKSNHDVEHALDFLIAQRSPAYEILIDSAESCCESVALNSQGIDYDGLLFCAPILAWTRYQLPQAQLDKSAHQALSSLLAEYIFTEAAQISLIPELVRFDQLPRSFRDSRKLSLNLAQIALGQKHKYPVCKADEDYTDPLADVYFLLGAAVLPKAEAIFQWQQASPQKNRQREDLQKHWQTSCQSILESVFRGCQLEFMLPQAFYSNARQADQNIRPMIIKAAVTWLQTAAGIPSSELRAAIVSCGVNNIEEYRIGFSTRTDNDVIYGAVWPSLTREESSPETSDSQVDAWDIIAAVLRECGITDVRRIPKLQESEYCDECDMPYFPNMLGEMVHADLPEEIDPDPVQLH